MPLHAFYRAVEANFDVCFFEFPAHGVAEDVAVEGVFGDFVNRFDEPGIEQLYVLGTGGFARSADDAAEALELARRDFALVPRNRVKLGEAADDGFGKVANERLKIDAAAVGSVEAAGIMVAAVNSRLIAVGGVAEELVFAVDQ